MNRLRFLVALFAFVCWLNTAPLVVAQVSQNLTENASNITVSPRYPEPGETVRLELNDYSLNTSGATYVWFVNGKEVTEARNERKLSLNTDDSGTTLNVLVRTTLSSGATVEARTTIKPIRVDLLVEAETLVPTFYAGRALPSSGSLTRVTAVPLTNDGKSAQNFSYVWKVGEEVASGGSRFGKNSVTFRSGFQASVDVSVDIIDGTGAIVTSDSISVPITPPELYFYEVNPLEGLKEKALDKDYIFVGDEIRVRAEPYYVDRTLMAQNPFIEWELNRQTIANPSSDPQEIVLRRSGQKGFFELGFHVRNLSQLLQGVEDSINIKF